MMNPIFKEKCYHGNQRKRVLTDILTLCTGNLPVANKLTSFMQQILTSRTLFGPSEFYRTVPELCEDPKTAAHEAAILSLISQMTLHPSTLSE